MMQMYSNVSVCFLPLEEIDKMNSWEGSQLNEAKEILAFELTKLVHGEEEATKAQESARALFTGGNAANMPTTILTADDFNAEGKIGILDIMVKAELVASKAEARRNVQQGGVTVNDEKVTEPVTFYDKDAFTSDFIIKRGKKNFRKIVVE